ncbi:MAG: hypothetical protein E6K70_07500 [Planctomycetota bacterium]|nr:MAG: hypothetical protein E6K70_07500 [Planctomycetota bacterium]
MTIPGLLALVCASAFVAADPAGAPAANDPTDKTVTTVLAVQSALQEGREHLLHGEHRAAVSVLESQLPCINGNKVYLKALEDAYRGYIKELRLAKQDADAQRYLQRLLYLDKGALLDRSLTGGSATLEASPVAAAARIAAQAPPRTSPVVRAKSQDDRPEARHIQSGPGREDASGLLARAQREFEDKRYPEARRLYEQAYLADEQTLRGCQDHRDRFGYCKLAWVVEQVNQAAQHEPSWPELEKEVKAAVDLAPRLDDPAKKLLARIRDPHPSTLTSAGRSDSVIAVRHSERNAQGWYVAESPNFRIYHKQSPEAAEQAAQVAEGARARVQQKWFGDAGEVWDLKCDLYLHPRAEDYSRETGKYNSPGHSTMRVENGRLVVRRIDVHCDDPNMLVAVLPHETTHVVLAGAFGGQLVPRWADEGLAVLTEPREKVQRHLDNLARCRQNNELFHLKDLLLLPDYPENPRYIGAFYAESVSLVEFLSSQKGPQEFTLFLHDALRYGPEKALPRHYNFQDFNDLEQHWFQSAFNNQRASTGTP